MKYFFLITATLLLWSCGSYKQKVFQKYAYDSKNLPEVALVCSKLVPCIEKESITEIEKEVIEDKTEGEEILTPSGDIVKCPDCICKKEVITKTITNTIEDTRKIELVKKELLDYKEISERKNKELLEKENELKEVKKKNNKKGWIIYGTLGALALLGFLKIRNKLSIF